MMLADDLQYAGYTVAGPFSHVAAALAWLECFSPHYRQASGAIPAGRIIAVRRVR
jgi:hypothetical protein